MVKVRIEQPEERPSERPRRKPKRKPEPETEAPKRPTGPTVRAARGMTERQWFISLLVAAGLLLLLTFRGCVLPSGVGPKSEPAAGPEETASPAQTVEADVTEYTVVAGYNLGKISDKTGASIDAIAEANGITRQTILRVGQVLTIP